MTTLSPNQWPSLRERFLQRHPDFVSFSQPGVSFARAELDYKRGILRRFEERGVREEITRLVAEGKGLEALKLLKRVNFENLISFYAWDIQFGTTDEQACIVLSGLLKTIQQPYSGPGTLLPLLEATDDAGTLPDWDVLKILWAFRPDNYFPIGIAKLRAFSKLLGVDLVRKKRLSIEHYPTVREFVLGFAPYIVEQWGPANLTEIQSVVWDIAYHEVEAASAANGGRIPEENEVDDDEEDDNKAGVSDAPTEARVQAGTQMWVIGAGEGACYWKDWESSGYIALGWEIGDVREMTSKEEIREALVEEVGSGGMNDVLAMYQFGHEMKVGDQVFVKQGRSRLLGWGVVTSDYRFEGEHYPHRRSVQWMSREVRVLPADLMMGTKTLTCIRLWWKLHPVIRQFYDLEVAPALVSPVVACKRYTREDALRDLFMPEAQVDLVLAQLRRRKNVVLQGPPGVGKTFIAKRLACLLMGEVDNSRMKMVQFHQSYSYEDFIQGFRPREEGGFSLRQGHFYKFCRLAQADPNRDYFFIIDEINRGNLSKIFGELLMLLEHDKRGLEHTVELAYASGESEEPELFWVPENVHVIGTMNTADKSLAWVDFAMRRRFAFVTLPPEFGGAYQRWMVGECKAPPTFVSALVDRIHRLNLQIADDRQVGSGCCIGHSFFTPVPTNLPADWDEWLKEVVDHEVEPLLQEYWPNEPDKVVEAARMLKA